MVLFRVLCAIRTRLQSCWWFCCPWLLSNYLFWRHQVAINMTWHQDGRTFVVKCETHERVPILLFGRLVRCSAHGRSFARLRYTYREREGSPIRRTSWNPFLVASVQAVELRTFIKRKTYQQDKECMLKMCSFEWDPSSSPPLSVCLGRHWYHSWYMIKSYIL